MCSGGRAGRRMFGNPYATESLSLSENPSLSDQMKGAVTALPEEAYVLTTSSNPPLYLGLGRSSTFSELANLDCEPHVIGIPGKDTDQLELLYLFASTRAVDRRSG